jgi:hypothetical protein
MTRKRFPWFLSAVMVAAIVTSACDDDSGTGGMGGAGSGNSGRGGNGGAAGSSAGNAG